MKNEGALLTEEEIDVLNTLADAYNKFTALDVLNDWHQKEFMHSIHEAQRLVLARPAIRQLRKDI